MTTTTQKVNLNNGTLEQLFKAMSKIQAKAAANFVKDEMQIGHHMKHVTQ
jgi:DNA uptake protein ComE-like DNA-binding protein